MGDSIFSGFYWKTAWKELSNLRKLIFAALLGSLSVIAGAFYIMVGDNLRVYFTFLITAAGCAVYGPVMGVVAAVVTDTLNFILFPSGPYFPGYVLSEICSALIYALFLYRRKISLFRLLGAKLMVNYFVNVLLGCVWSEILSGKGYLYYLVKSTIKNTLMLPVEVIALSALFSFLAPVFSRFGLPLSYKKINFQQPGAMAKPVLILGIVFILGCLCSLYYGITSASEAYVFYILAVLFAMIGVILFIYGCVHSLAGHSVQ